MFAPGAHARTPARPTLRLPWFARCPAGRQHGRQRRMDRRRSCSAPAAPRLMLPCRTGQPLGEPAPPKAAFADLPARKVLTLNMDVPEPWLVEPVQARACMRARAPFSNLCTRRAGRGRAPAFWPARKTGCLCTSVLSSCVPAQSGTCAHARLGPAPFNSPRAACHLAPTPRMQSWARRATAACPGMSARARGASAAQAPLDLDNLHLANGPYNIPYRITYLAKPYPVP